MFPLREKSRPDARIDPAFINAKASLLQRFHNAYAASMMLRF
jgi:hypothetical protein